jgi:L-histidine Nalpha-methyltransferase / hercynylcysteine S-oxide synthase
MAYKTNFSFPSVPEEYASNPVPSLTEWANLWAVWDILTRHMIPDDELLAKPIKLRNVCIFYLGHIPTFLDIHLSKATGVYSKELEYYQRIFERGIDPDVDNPELCHDHSEIPDSWPSVDEIVAYQGAVRDRVRNLFASGQPDNNHAVHKALWIGFEHEVMHLETLLYMLVQSEKTLPPPGVVKPDFESLAAEAVANKAKIEWITVYPQTVNIGMNDQDDDLKTTRYFGWDNEKPQRVANVAAFQARSQPITNKEYAQYLKEFGIKSIPASWTENPHVPNGHMNGLTNGITNGIVNGIANGIANGLANGTTNGDYLSSFIEGKSVRTVFGKIPLRLALDWPVMASYDELAGCAAWLGGRIPTMEEVKSIYQNVEELKSKEIKNRSEKIPAVNSHLINNGVEETPPPNGCVNRSSGAAKNPSPESLFVDLQQANVGFKNWHPVAVTGESKLLGHAELGGVWEWTSTVLERHEGFEPMKLYPGYTGKMLSRNSHIIG